MRRSSTEKTKPSQERGSLSPLLSAPEAAELLGMKTWTLRQWLSQRRIAFAKVGRLTKLTQEDITAFIASNRKEPISHDRDLFV